LEKEAAANFTAAHRRGQKLPKASPGHWLQHGPDTSAGEPRNDSKPVLFQMQKDGARPRPSRLRARGEGAIV
jgi:hypothetical protein